MDYLDKISLSREFYPPSYLTFIFYPCFMLIPCLFYVTHTGSIQIKFIFIIIMQQCCHKVNASHKKCTLGVTLWHIRRLHGFLAVERYMWMTAVFLTPLSGVSVLSLTSYSFHRALSLCTADGGLPTQTILLVLGSHTWLSLSQTSALLCLLSSQPVGLVSLNTWVGRFAEATNFMCFL